MTPAHSPPQWIPCLLSLLLLWVGDAWAGQVIITMPDDNIQAALHKVCEWWHCWKDDATYASDTALTQHVSDQLVQAISLGHYPDLAYIGGQIEIRYDEPQEPLQP